MKIRNEEAVSPVIGVILMVAITVVLAAVLYVWASSFVQTTGSTPRITHKLEKKTNDYAITLASVVPAADLVEVTMAIRSSTGQTRWTAETIDLYDFGTWIDNDNNDDVSVGDRVANIPPNMLQGDGITNYDYTLAAPPPTEYAWGGYMYSDEGAPQTNANTFWNTYTNTWGPGTTGQVIFVNNDAGQEVTPLVVALSGTSMTVTTPGVFKLSAGDQYYIRSTTNGGDTEAENIFELVFDPTGEIILSIPLI